MLAIISIAILISFFFTLDLIQTPKKGAFYVRNLIQLIVISIPSVYKSVNSSEAQFLINWDKYFYCIFAISFFIFILFTYFLHYKQLVYSANRYGIDKEFSFVGFLQIGNSSFQDEINGLIDISVKNKTKIASSVFKSLSASLPKYICDLNLAVVDASENKYDLIDFSCFVLETFISNFLSHTDARFSIRKYDPETNAMNAVFSTRHEDLPSPIPLNKDNLITLSMKNKRPVIYSRNKKFHYDTKKSLKNNMFDDYVTYCIVADSNKNIPMLSVNLDVKGTQSIKRMQTLVDNSIFTIICDTIKIKSMVLESNKGLCNESSS